MTRVDADHAGAVTPGEFDEVVGVGAVAHFGRVPAPHQDVAAVEPVLALVAGDERAPDGGCSGVDGGPRVGIVDAETTAVQVQQAAGGVRAIELVVGAGAVGDKERAVAVFGFDALELSGDAVEGFVPGNALELAFAACPRPFERMQQPVGVVLAAQVGASARTGTQLGSSEAVRPVVSVQPDDTSVFEVGDQQTASAAVVGRTADTDFLDNIRKAHIQ